MKRLNNLAKAILISLISSDILVPAVSFIITRRLPMFAIIFSSIVTALLIAFIIFDYNARKFVREVEEKNRQVEEEYNLKKTDTGDMVNLTYKQYKQLIKKGFVPIGNGTKIVELSGDNNGDSRQK